MSAFKNNKTHLDDFFAEARTNPNIAPAENLLQRTIPENSFKSGFMKIGFAGVVAVTALSFFLLKDDDLKSEKVVLKIKTDTFKKEIVKENAAKVPDFKNNEKPVLKNNEVVFKKEFSVKNSFKSRELKEENIALLQSPENIILTAIPLVELRDFELRKLGIEVLKDGDIQLTHSTKKDTVHYVEIITNRPLSEEEANYLNKLSLSPYKSVSWEEHQRLNPPSFEPKRITDLSGTRLFMEVGETSDSDDPVLIDLLQGNVEQPDNSLKLRLRKWADEEAHKQDSIEKTRKYIPIRAGNFIVWYSPESEVLSRLPESVCNSIHAELTGNNIVSANEFREEYPTSGFCYLDLCEKTNGAIICSKVSPNPAPDKRTTLSYELSEERGIVTALYDLSGRKLREFCALKTMEKGKHDEEISLDGIEKGIYLIAIITDKGEKLSRRLIID
ncbi:MAG: T9SS type A sorting domain-containing protein [Bacteroidota bacterium]